MTTRLVAVFGSSQSTSTDPEWQEGYRCGELLALAGFGVATGGYGGLMEAVSAGAAAGGGHVVGVTAPAIFPDRDAPNRHVSEEWPATTLPERIGDLLGSTAASIALQGSIGTLTELVTAWNIAYIARLAALQPQPVVTVGPAWQELVGDLAQRLDTDVSLVHCAPTVDAAVDHVIGKLAE